MTGYRFDRRTVGALAVAAYTLFGAVSNHTEARRNGGTEGDWGLHTAATPNAAEVGLRAAATVWATPRFSPGDQARAAAASPEITVTIAPDVLARAGIQTAPARVGRAADGLRIPATVQPNAYKQVTVVSTAAGRVLAVPAELGQRVAQGDVVLQLHCPEVAEREREYIGKQGDMLFVRQQIARLERLVTIGAASQQELDAVRAEQTSVAADIEGARASLLLLGRTPADVDALKDPAAISATLPLLAPITGTITTRSANPGDVIEAKAALLTIVDLDTVWIVGDVYERDLANAQVGRTVTMTAPAFPGDAFSGRITYVDPQMALDSRTARVRVELQNPGGRLRLGMLMEMRIGGASAESVLIPRTAVQTIGSVSVVYVASGAKPGTFVERSVRLGGAGGDDVQVAAGLAAGESVVTSGSFFVRAERDRTHPGAPGAAPALTAPRPVPRAPATVAGPQTFDIAITEQGFTPAEVNVPSNTPVRLRFTRKVEATCATEVVFPALKIQKPLPLGQPVIIDVPPQAAGHLAFACGMNMFKGQLIVK